MCLARNGARLPQDAAKHGQHGAVGPSTVQFADLFAGQDHGSAKFGMGALKVVAIHDRSIRLPGAKPEHSGSRWRSIPGLWSPIL